MLISFACCGCNNIAGYSNDSLFPRDVRTVYVEMFDNRTFRRGTEYDLSDALAKRIEADTPYKIVTSRDRADSVISGHISLISEAVLSVDRKFGTALEKELIVEAWVNWKNLNTGDLMIEGQNVSGSASYSPYQSQDFKYASTLAANNLAQRIVELMETKW
jgi:hypothetical protein